MELLNEERDLLPQLEGLLEVYEAALRMAEATDNSRDLRVYLYRVKTLEAFVSQLRPRGDSKTQALF